MRAVRITANSNVCPSAKGSVMCSLQSINLALILNLHLTEGGKLVNYCLLKPGFKQAIAAVCAPYMQQEPLMSEDNAGEWLLSFPSPGQTFPSIRESCPRGSWMQVFMGPGRLGRPDPRLRPEAMARKLLLDDSSVRAIGFRIGW